MEQDAPSDQELNKFLAWLGFVLLATIVICGFLNRSKSAELDRRWKTSIEQVSGTRESELLTLFAAWQERVAQRDGRIELWAGAQSEVLFIESEPKCDFHHDRYWVPCWTVWARTKQSQRLYRLLIRIDIDNDWRLSPDLHHDEVDVQSVTRKALQLGKEAVLRRAGVIEVNA